jgi:hypothetical protein
MPSTHPDEVIAKIRKLLRLGRGSNHAAEAQAAMAKALEIAEGAGLSINDVDMEKEPVKITHERGGARRVTFARRQVFILLKSHFSIDVIISSARGATFVGPSVNIAIAKHVETYLLRASSAELKTFLARTPPKQRRTPKQRRRLSESFLLGFFNSVDQTLSMRPIRNDAAEIKIAIAHYMGQHFTTRTRPSGKIGRIDTGALSDGVRQGRNHSLDRPIEGAQSTLRLTSSE